MDKSSHSAFTRLSHYHVKKEGLDPFDYHPMHPKWLSLFFIVLGYILIVVGVFVFWLPIPFGLIMMTTGFYLLIKHSAWFTRWFTQSRRRYPKFNLWLRQKQNKLPEGLRRVLEKTEP